MKLSSAIFVILLTIVWAKDCPIKKSQSKLFCYYSKITQVDSCKCSHVVLPANSDFKLVDRVREQAKGVKILITVNEFNQGLVDLLKSSKVDGVEINLKKLESKNDISDFITTVRTKLGNDLYIALSVPSKAEHLAKYYDFKALTKTTDVFVLETAFLGASTNVTFHPSRLSGLWDMQNTDSVVDLVNGLGAPLSKLVITSPVQAFSFKLQNEEHTAAGSPALEVQSLSRDEFCKIMKNGEEWTMERDQDQTGPYIFSKDRWIAFEDLTSIDIKAKYSRIRGLAGMALKDLSQDGGTCESTILDAAFTGLSRQARAPRGAVLHSLEREILETSPRHLDKIQVSPYRITKVIDTEGNVHSIRQDTRTEFECSRQGYFVHPRSCGRFYRCVKFDQLSDEFNVFEFDCPAGLAFDERVEVCVWPGSLPHASACSGSSEIAPVPRERFICPGEQGYYADPENCRWFFACLDHGKSPLSAYEFRCPFGLVYDEERLLCEWPWLVPRCASGLAVGSEVVYGGSGLLTLDQYNGLGVLGTTRLGGLHGTFQQPAAKVYSNVGAIEVAAETGAILNSVGAGDIEYHGNEKLAGIAGGSGAALVNAYGSNNLGYSSGLSLKASQSLRKAGLLNSGLNYASNLNLGQYASNSGAYVAGNLNQYQGNAYSNNGQYAGDLHDLYEYQANSAYNSQANAHAYANSAYNYNNVQTGSRGTGAGIASGLNYATVNGASLGSQSLDTNAHLINELAYDSAAKSQQSFTQYHGQAGNVLLNSNANQAVLVNANYASGTSGNIDIVGGGYSAGIRHSGVQINNNGEDSLIHSYVTSSPFAVSTLTSVPSVTSVPVPALKVATGFQTFKGGVVANVPELQYQIQKPASYYTNINSGIGAGQSVFNASANFLNLVSSTPSTLSVGYQYPKPSVAFVEEPARTFYQKPISTTTFVQQTPIVSTHQKPVIVSTTQTPVIVEKLNIHQPAISYNVQKQDTIFTGYNYPKPSIKFEETSIKLPTPTIAVSQGYNYPKPIVAFEETPLRTVHQPAVSTYSYSTPTTVRPLTVQPLIQVQQPLIKQQVHIQPVIEQHPAVSVSSFQGYNYPKPSVAFEERPQIHVTSYSVPSSTIKPVVYQQPQVYVSSTPTPIVHQQFVQPRVEFKQQSAVTYSQGYQYPKPTVAFEEKPSIISYQQPITKTVTAQPVSTYNYKNVVQQAVGYSYPKPAIRFEETPVIYQQQQPDVVSTYSYTAPSTPKPVVLVQKSQPLVNTYSYQTPVQTIVQKQTPIVQVQNPVEGYSYPKPAIRFEETPVTYQQQQPAVVSSYSYTPSTSRPAVVVQKQQPIISTYSYKTPVQTYIQKQAPVIQVQQPIVVQKPTVVSSYSYSAPSTPRPAILVEKQQPLVNTYTYQTPVQTVIQKQTPIVPVQQPVVGYSYPKPEIRFEETPVTYRQQPAVVSSYSYTPSTPKPAVFIQKQQPVINSYSYEAPVQTYIQKVQQPVVVQKPSIVSYTAPSTVKPAIAVQPVVQTYNYITPTPKPVVVQKTIEFSGYDYPQPTIPFVEQPAPVVTYKTRQPIQEVPFVAKKAYVTGGQSSSYYQQHVEQKPVVIQSYQTPVPQIIVSSTPRYELKQQQYSNVNQGYVYEKPIIQYEEKPRPVIVENYQAPNIDEINFINYQKVQKVVQQQVPKTYYPASTPRPNLAAVVNTVIATKAKPQQPFYLYDTQLSTTPTPFVKFDASVPLVETVSTTSRPIVRYSFSSLDDGYKYEKPIEPVREYLPVTTPAPVVVPTREYLPVRQKVKITTQTPVYIEEVAVPTREYLPVRQRVKVTTQTPLYIEEVPVPTQEYLPIRQKVKITTQIPVYIEEKPVPTLEYLPVRQRVKITTPAPVIIKNVPTREYLPIRPRVRVTTPRPIIIQQTAVPTREYQPVRTTTLEPFIVPEVTREYLPVRQRVRVTTPRPTEAYIVTEPTKEYLPVRTKSRVKVTTLAYAVPEVTTPSREYLPVRSRARVTSTEPSREYLPVQEEVVSIRRPAKVVKIVRPAKTIVKQNDFHPLITTKLGAQCSCISNDVKLRRKKPLQIVVEEDDEDDDDNDDDDNDDDGYVVSNGDDQDQDVVVENYQYEPQKVVDITPSPQVVIKSTTSLIEPSPIPTLVIRKRVRVRPVTEAIEVFVKNPAVSYESSTEEPSDREIVKAVRTGLKLVKQAAKQGAKEGTAEVLAGKDFDRYGPGGVRSKNERLQGTIDCQRAGLFRHPNQCNKFYACRWDCKKNRFTLHVFNCPVHLTFDNNLGACNWPSQGPACLENTLLPSE